MSHARVEAQLSFVPLPPRFPDFRRVSCACGCGRWFYWERAKHRPPAYATPECYRVAKNTRARQRAAAALDARGER